MQGQFTQFLNFMTVAAQVVFNYLAIFKLFLIFIYFYSCMRLGINIFFFV